MKKLLIGTALAAGYIALCRLTRGYWALTGDLMMIAITAATYLLLKKTLSDDREERDGQVTGESSPLFIRVIGASGGIREGVRESGKRLG